MQKTLKNRTIFCRDNLEVLRGIDSSTVDLIYLDPPFNKKREFAAPIGSGAEGASFHDIFREEDVKKEWLGLIAEQQPTVCTYIQGMADIGHKSNKNYLSYMAVRLIEIHRVLKNTGSLYLHCDPTMSHYLKLLLDCIFGENNFRNELIWFYHDSPGRSIRYFPKKHDIILWYSKSDRWTFNEKDIRVPIKPLSKERYKTPRIIGGRSYIGGDSSEMGKIPESVWSIPVVKRNSKQSTGYPTQKPLALLERIIRTSSNKGDLVLDPFCGCATTCVAAERLNRQWIGIDVSEKAFALVKIRLKREIEDPDPLFKRNALIYREDIPQRADIKDQPLALRAKNDKKRYLYGLQEGKCKGCGARFDYRHLTVDHMVAQAKGGADNLENLQLLCFSCNIMKGKKDMTYLKAKLKELGIL